MKVTKPVELCLSWVRARPATVRTASVVALTVALTAAEVMPERAAGRADTDTATAAPAPVPAAPDDDDACSGLALVLVLVVLVLCM